MMAPVLMLLQMSTIPDAQIMQTGPSLEIGGEFWANLDKALFGSMSFSGRNTGLSMFVNSMILGLGFALGKIVIALMAAYAIVYFRMRFATLAFWLIFTTLLLPLEVRIVPSYEITQKLGLLNTYTGMILPLIASATATFFFGQFFLSVPEGPEGNSTPEYGRSNLLGLRPEDFVVDRAGALVMRIDIVEELCARKLAHGRLDEQRLVIEMAKGFALPRGEIRVAIAPGALCVFSAENGLRLADPVTRDERVLEPA